ncbi:uncharacterized protein LOC117285122 [Fukomys damarensis]|uniref:uncharacterized protein LOC117285122 n=1 Tax=Fukomys damarensis TaxID=885580 RepID=UPI001454F77F|nr:uncharacterized protein LOC117285122 [Fukomys damarensis]
MGGQPRAPHDVSTNSHCRVSRARLLVPPREEGTAVVLLSPIVCRQLWMFSWLRCLEEKAPQTRVLSGSPLLGALSVHGGEAGTLPCSLGGLGSVSSTSRPLREWGRGMVLFAPTRREEIALRPWDGEAEWLSPAPSQVALREGDRVTGGTSAKRLCLPGLDTPGLWRGLPTSFVAGGSDDLIAGAWRGLRGLAARQWQLGLCPALPSSSLISGGCWLGSQNRPFLLLSAEPVGLSTSQSAAGGGHRGPHCPVFRTLAAVRFRHQALGWLWRASLPRPSWVPVTGALGVTATWGGAQGCPGGTELAGCVTDSGPPSLLLSGSGSYWKSELLVSVRGELLSEKLQLPQSNFSLTPEPSHSLYPALCC